MVFNQFTECFGCDIKGNVTDHYIEDKDIGTIATGYEYDKLNRVTKVYTELGVQSISYDKANRIVKSENTKNGMAKSYTYNPQGTVNTIKTRQDDKLVYSEYYEYDKNGNKTYSDENGNIKKYNYDGMGRLQRVVDNNAVQTEYEFDAYNNISKEYQLVGTDVSTKSYYYDANNRLTLATTKYDVEQFDYDKEGNLTHKKEDFGQNVSTTYYKYDGYNRLKNVISDTTEAEYHYNIGGLRDKKTVDEVTTRFTYDGDKIAGEYTKGEYYKYYRANELIGYVNNQDEGYYYRQNSHGDVTAILDYQGKELKSYDYTPYGKQKEIQIEPKGSKTIIYQWEKETDKTHNPFKYAGEYQDEETDNIYLRARYYDVSIGRFTQEDPIKDGLNWYGYCDNNPVNRWDPTGLEEAGDKEKYGENSPKYKMLVALGYAWHVASGDEKAQNRIHEMAGKLRYFDDNSFNRLIFLNYSKGAGGLGHSAILLLNKEGEGLFFSYYPMNPSDALNIDADMRFAVLDKGESNKLLYGDGRAESVVENDGHIVTGLDEKRNDMTEKYNRFIYYDITNGQGYNMYFAGADIFKDPGNYKLLGWQCDDVAKYIMSTAGIGYKVEYKPNKSYENLKKNRHSWSINN